jgi:NifU-like protein
LDVVYPDEITDRLAKLAYCGGPADGVSAIEANFTCGSAVRFFISVDSEAGFVEKASFTSNGCGYLLAAADVLAGYVEGKHLADLHGLEPSELRTIVFSDLNEFPQARILCIDTCIGALRAAFAEFRRRGVDEFRGERALVCTCFGVSEETVERVIANGRLRTVEQVTVACRAGGGCGSCTFLIQEMLDGPHP